MLEYAAVGGGLLGSDLGSFFSFDSTQGVGLISANPLT